jgi:ribosomal protein L11 methyltransferase
MEWFRITLSPPPSCTSDEIDGLCSGLIEAGASGTTIEEKGTISCFVEGSSEKTTEIAAVAQAHGCTILSQEAVQEENWNQQCTEVWQPVNAGTLKVIPVETLDDSSAQDPSSIKIIPGQGFGTGHHPTTRMILETLSARSAQLSTSNLSIFDLGTGSGILAIAAAKLFNRPVEAVDNDAYAITNAKDNVALNGLCHLISPSTTPIENLTTPYNLILANLYGEVLVHLAPEVTRLAMPGCIALMSGITELVRDSVVDTYTEKHGWVVDEERSDSGWHCVTLVRP